VRPIIALNPRRAKTDPENPYRVPRCEHGTWVFSGSDYANKRAKYRCPTGRCSPASKWLRADRLRPLLPRGSPRWQVLYNTRTSAERCFSRLKQGLGLLDLRLRGKERVELHVDLAIMTLLSLALVHARAGP